MSPLLGCKIRFQFPLAEAHRYFKPRDYLKSRSRANVTFRSDDFMRLAMGACVTISDFRLRYRLENSLHRSYPVLNWVCSKNERTFLPGDRDLSHDFSRVRITRLVWVDTLRLIFKTFLFFSFLLYWDRAYVLKCFNFVYLCTLYGKYLFYQRKRICRNLIIRYNTQSHNNNLSSPTAYNPKKTQYN